MATYYVHDISSNNPYEGMTTPVEFSSLRNKKKVMVTSLTPTLSSRRSQLVACTFYAGIFITLLGSMIFLISIGSSHWVVFSVPSREMTMRKRGRFLAHFGPWEACNHGGECGLLWEMVPGLSEVPVRLTQAIFVATACLYVVGVLLIALDMSVSFGVFGNASPQMWSFLVGLWRLVMRHMLIEIVLPFAAVAAFISMLIMGQLKRRVILRDHQEETVGVGFTSCLFGVLVSVFGMICTIINRFVSHDSRVVRYMKRIKTARIGSLGFTPAPMSTPKSSPKTDEPNVAPIRDVKVRGGRGGGVYKETGGGDQPSPIWTGGTGKIGGKGVTLADETSSFNGTGGASGESEGGDKPTIQTRWTDGAAATEGPGAKALQSQSTNRQNPLPSETVRMTDFMISEI